MSTAEAITPTPANPDLDAVKAEYRQVCTQLGEMRYLERVLLARCEALNAKADQLIAANKSTPSDKE